MPYETDLDTAFTILLGKAVGIGVPTPVPTPAPTPTPTATPTTRVVNIAFDLGVDDTPIATGTHLTFRLGLNGTARVLSWSLAGLIAGASTSGTAAVDVKVGTTVSGVTSICGGDEPELTSDTELTEQAVTGNWSPAIPDPRWVQARVISTSGTLERLLLTLRAIVE
jgi:hypothetical protein